MTEWQDGYRTRVVVSRKVRSGEFLNRGKSMDNGSGGGGMREEKGGRWVGISYVCGPLDHTGVGWRFKGGATQCETRGYFGIEIARWIDEADSLIFHNRNQEASSAMLYMIACQCLSNL